MLSLCADILLNKHFYLQLGPKFMKENGLNHVTFSTADGALEAAPAVSSELSVYIFIVHDVLLLL